MIRYAILIGSIHSAIIAALIWGLPVRIGGLTPTAVAWAITAALLYAPVVLVWAVLLGYGSTLVKQLLAELSTDAVTRRNPSIAAAQAPVEKFG